MLDLETNTLQELRLTQVALSIEQIKAIAKSMPLMPNITGIYLEDTNLTDDGFAIILDSIEKNIASFKSITLKGTENKFGQKSFPILQRILQRKVPF